MQHDLALLAAFLVATAFYIGLPRYLRWLALLLQAGLLLLIIADLVILAEFGMRLSWRDVLKFGGELGAVEGYLGTKLTTITGLLWLAGIGILLGSWISHLRTVRHCGRGTMKGIMIAAATCFSLYALSTTAHHPLPWLYRNVVEINLPSGVDRPYSKAYRSHVLAAYQPPPCLCTKGRRLKDNVVIVIIESWSWYHSKDRLGIMDATPHLDRLARRGTLWTRFFSNGFTTDHGLIALLGGAVPIPAVNRYHSLAGYTGFAELPESLPRRLAADGYETHFFTNWVAIWAFFGLAGPRSPQRSPLSRRIRNGHHPSALRGPCHRSPR